MESRDSILLEAHYWPCISYFKTIKQAKALHLEAQEHYQKGSYRNRLYVPASNGVQLLSVPLEKGKNQHIPIQEVQISNRLPWRRAQWKTIYFLYKSAPYFEHYEPELQSLFMEEEQFLFQQNVKILRWLMQQFQLKVAVHYTAEYEANPAQHTDLRNTITPSTASTNTPIYFQPFSDKVGFKSNMSALDLLLMNGPEAAAMLV